MKTDQATNATPQAVCSTAMLGPLPPYTYGRECAPNERVWTERDMRAYALQERAAERERCASMAENYDLGTIEGHAIAAGIRGPNVRGNADPTAPRMPE